MKNLIKVFAVSAFVVAVMFSANSAEAWSEYDKCRANGGSLDDCRKYAEGDIRDIDQADDESEVADSGNEGTTSAAQESDQ